MNWALRFHGTGNAASVAEFGSAMATIERDGSPWLTIDCGSEGLSDHIARYGRYPDALFITHAHLDHVSGFERMFVGSYFNPARRGKVRVYCPVGALPHVQRRIAGYPNVLAEGGANFWDAFQLIVVGDHFWHDGVRFEVFPVRHHWPDSAFGLRLPGSLVWTGDTRPIPEMLEKVAARGELIAHDCALIGNPSHSGIDDLRREYPTELLARCVLYHYAGRDDLEALRGQGLWVAEPGDRVILAMPEA
ncbi:ribonuclease Z [Lysobacter pythonis]|uniref:Ribonuclease Z n=1 Tax=Solilutibacter pythonis TaxID=2483112 RepID=A0A3M2I0R9_9GAMM|nr:MBL fold metallo-hydrolase [Lysobacter pythonis]RMH94758.1 ribonuclease Z [Lysobacter pythonis]